MKRSRSLADYLLDTSAASALMRRDPRALKWVSSLPGTVSVHLPAVGHGEILYGLLRLPAGHRRDTLESDYLLLRSHLPPPLPISEDVAEAYAAVRSALDARGIRLPENDLWIAATALTNGLTLVTDDQHFRSVPRLETVTWYPPDPAGARGAPS